MPTTSLKNPDTQPAGPTSPEAAEIRRPEKPRVAEAAVEVREEFAAPRPRPWRIPTDPPPV